MNACKIIAFCVLCLLVHSMQLYAQEKTAPLHYNAKVNAKKNSFIHKQKSAAKKTSTALSLPFFEDFTTYDIFPDSNKWMDNEVYINNTMGVCPISRGVATFDNLNQYGLPYDTLTNTDFRFNDSLTSKPIDLSSLSPTDSVYFSFYYQPQGNGFYPIALDSFMLYFSNRYGDFVRVWTVPGSVLQPFQLVMIPITDTLFFSSSFQFRFVNYSALYWADADWNIDYIKIDKNRGIGDTMISDVAYTADPTNLLNDYTAMPYNQFITNPAGEIATQVSDSIRNDSSWSQSLNYSFNIIDITSSPANLYNSGFNLLPVAAYQTVATNNAFSITTYPVYPPNTTVVFQNTYNFQSTATTGNTINDTIVKDQIFDNYLAYDDGTAEQAYYLNLASSGIPGEVSIEFHLNKPDTLRGLAIYFDRQVPLAHYKEFYINIYSTLIGVNGFYTDTKIYEQDFNYPGYIDTINHFWVYKFENPVLLPAGTFYAGTEQPAFSASDSLYFGLDVNRVGSNHAYYRVYGAGTPWNPSLIAGAIMIRPLLGHDIKASSIKNVISATEDKWYVSPNPAKDKIQLFFNTDTYIQYSIIDALGRQQVQGNTQNGNTINIADLMPGVYFITIKTGNNKTETLKFIKI